MIGSWDLPEDFREPIGSDDNDADDADILLTELVENLEEENAELKEENKRLKLEKSTTESELRIKELEAQLKQITAENEELKKQIKNSDNFMQEPMDEVQELNLHQKIVFFNTVTSVMIDKRYTNLSKYASFIASMCNEKATTIGPKLSRIGQITDETPNPQLSATLHSAAQCVSDMLRPILTNETKNDKSQVINKIRENLLLNYPSPEDE